MNSDHGPGSLLRERTVHSRYVELDSLRGLAALSVVVSHCANAYSILWPRWYQVPLAAGHQAVVLFFVLSGFVLSLPFWNRGTNGPYGSYLVRRFFRIYVPFAAALAIAALGARCFLFSRLPLGPWFYDTWQSPLTPRLLLSELLLSPASKLNTAFWSLRYEVQLSFVFPLLLLVLRRLGTWGSLGLAFAAYYLGLFLKARWPDVHSYQETLHFGSMFVIGAVLASRRQTFRREGILSLRVVQVAVFVAGAALYLWGERIAVGFHCAKLDDLFVTAGASILLMSAIRGRRFAGLLKSKIPEYLGRVSYSMYLVHGTVLFVLLNLLYGKVPMVALVVIYGAATLAASHAFCRWVEEPSLRWGKRLAVGRPAASGSTA